MSRPWQDRTKLTPPELARRWGKKPSTIVALIRTGQLRAIDVAVRRGGRPRFLIDEADIALFEQSREVGGPKVSRIRRGKDPAVIEFF